MKILITGYAGFIGFHASREFLRRGWEVAGIDNFCDYYDVINVLAEALGVEPKTTIREGIPIFAKWYKEYHGL